MARTAADKQSSIGYVRSSLLACSLTCSILALLVVGAAGSTGVGGAQAPGHAPRPSTKVSAGTVKISSATCIPTIHCSTNPRQVSLHGELLVRGRSVRKGMVVAFPRSYGARIARNSPTAHILSSGMGLVVHVPSSAHSGRIMILLGHGRHSNSYGPIQVVRYALHPPSRPAVPSTAPPSGTAFDGQGMWIWYVSQSDGGSLAAIVAQAHAAGASTLFVKSSDGSTNYWSQFSPALVQQLHANGLRVCAWQYVYGANPAGEASLGARAVSAGADCLAIDAEAEYEGKYGAAQTYIADLREKIGDAYPLGLASFPYVYYHSSLPFSVFFGPNGAQFDAPQMYWKAIGNSVDTVYANTYISNRPYGRPIAPLGQTYENPSSADLLRFREEALLYGATGISFWDFQETSENGWKALGAPLAPLTSVTPNAAWAELSQGSKGDSVLWMQEHLASAIPGQATTGIFDSATKMNLEQFQTTHGIAPTGHTEAATWQALLALPPVAVDWTGGGPKG